MDVSHTTGPQIEYRLGNIEQVALVDETWLVVGREPGDDGIRINDRSVSAEAVAFRKIGEHLEIRNRSSEAAVTVSGAHGPRHIEPGESLAVVTDCMITITGEVMEHGLRVSGIEKPPSELSAGTWRFRQAARPITEQRELALVALCLPHFERNSYPNGRITSTEIASELARHGEHVTPKEVSNKLDRVRGRLVADGSPPLHSRAELIAFVTSRHLVTETDIRRFRAHQRSRRTSARGQPHS